MTLHSIREGWLIAVDQLRANKLRSGLTILGVVIGIATVMAMASIVAGFREQIVNTLEVVGPTTFRILRFFSSTPLNPDALPREVRIRPALAPEEAEAIARLPEIHYAAIWTQLFYRFEYAGNRTQILGVFGADDRYMEILGGGLVTGRVFTTAELRGGAPVAVIEQRTVDRLFGARDPIGEIVRIGGRPFRVIGEWQRPTNIFEVPGAPEIAGIVPFEAARERFQIDQVRGLIILYRAPGGRDRGDGDHDGVGDQPDARDRLAQGDGRDASRRPLAIPGGGSDADLDGRHSRYHPGDRHRGAPQASTRLQHHRAGVECGDRDDHVDHGGARLRDRAGGESRAAGSRRGVEIRMNTNAECGMRNAELTRTVRSARLATECDARSVHSALRIPHSAFGLAA